jgi:hypothetical protein
VHSLAERNDLLARAEFIDAVLNNQSISVLLNGIANIVPQWSIWSLDPIAANRVLESNPGIRPDVALISNADLCFTLKKAFEYAVDTETERNNLIPSLKDGDRVYVANETQGFWAIWQWLRTGTTSGEFALWRVQTYDTTSFLQDIDWYADGYSAANPPIISYPTIAQRNATEGSTAPTNRLVKILNDGTGKFNWTAFIDGQWEVVAIEDGTVQLSDAFYDPLRTVYAVVTPTSPNLLPANTTLASAITNRDGSWEMRILTHALRYSGLLTESEINQVWFDIVNFCHVQQNEVEWAFKTSFMTLNGIAVPLQETPVLMADQTQNVVDFVNEVKPYHVKVRQSAIQYNPTLDIANGTPTDFDDPVYTDPATGIQRALDPTDPTDQAILQLAPYTDWYQNFATNASLIRHFTVTLLFDRIAAVSGNWDMSNWDTVLWDSGEGDGGAAYRLLTYYAPTAGMPPIDLEILLGLDAKTDAISSVLAGSFDTIDDGGTFAPETYDVDINPPLTSQPGGFDLRDPYVAAGQPEERVSFGADDGLQVIVTAKPLQGAPPQIIKVFEVGTIPGQTTTLFYDFMAGSVSAVMVFCDGVRAVFNTDYTVDLFARTITLNLTVNGSPVQRCAIHAFGCGGSSVVTEQHYLSYSTAAGLTLDSPSIANNVEVLVNGVQLTSSHYTVNGTQVTLTSPPSDGTDVALVVYDGGFNSASMMQIETLSYNVGQTWTLTLRDQQTMPEHAGTIVEVNGLRLTPPTTIYGSMTVAAPYVYIPQAPDVTTVETVYYNGQKYTHSIPVCTTTSPTSNYPFQVVLPGAAPPTTIAGQFVLYENLLIALDPNFVSDVVVVLTYTDSSPDYTVVNGVLTITKALSNSDVITSTTFTNAATMGIQTVAFNLGAPILETVVPQPFAKNYALVTMNGLALQPDDDFKIETESFSLGAVYFSRPVLTLNNPKQSGSVVATVFTGAAAREAMQWQYVTKTPASVRMIPALVTVQTNSDNIDGYDVAPLDTQPFDETQAVGVPTNGPITDPQPQFRIDTTFEYARLSPYMAGTLVADIPVGAASFDVQLFIQPIATKLQDPFPLPVPDNAHNRPGVVYIEGERIEYFGYSRSGDVVTISQLRRATRGTSMGSKRLVLTGTGTGSQETYAFPATGVLDFTLDDVPIAADQFAVVVNGGNTQVTFTASAGSYIVMGLTLNVTHRKDAAVYNGAMTFLKDVPIGPDVGNRELQPMHQIIAN